MAAEYAQALGVEGARGADRGWRSGARRRLEAIDGVTVGRRGGKCGHIVQRGLGLGM